MKATKKQQKHLLSFIFNNDKNQLLNGLNLAIDMLNFHPSLTFAQQNKEIDKRIDVLRKLYSMTVSPIGEIKNSKLNIDNSKTKYTTKVDKVIFPVETEWKTKALKNNSKLGKKK